MASSNVMAELAVAEGELPGSSFHISQDGDNGNISGNRVAVLHRCA